MHKELFCTTETPQKITEISRKCHGKSRKITENHGKSRKGFSRPITEIVEALCSEWDGVWQLVLVKVHPLAVQHVS